MNTSQTTINDHKTDFCELLLDEEWFFA